LKVQRDKLKQYHIKVNAVLTRETEIAKSLLLQGKKKQAMVALKKKKYQEQLLDKSEQQLLNIQEMVDSIEFAQMEKKVFDGLKQGNEVLKEIHSEMSVEAVEQLMSDTQDAIDYQNEIDEAISGKLSEEDNEAILAELEELEKESLVLPDVPNTPLPDVGKTKVSDRNAEPQEEITEDRIELNLEEDITVEPSKPNKPKQREKILVAE